MIELMETQRLKDARRPWWHAISVRQLLVLVLALAIVFGWVAQMAREQRRAKELIMRHNGVFFYDFEPQNATPHTRKTWVPAWLQRAIGEDYFHDVTWVRIEGELFGDADLERLKVLDRIEALGLEETAITDAGLRQLRGRKALKALWIGGNWIGDAGIDNLDLASMPQLEILEIRCTLVSDAKLEEIKRRFPKLMILDDGRSHRFISSRVGPRDERMVKPDDPELGPRRKTPPIRSRNPALRAK
jgi:hypothetical protein